MEKKFYVLLCFCVMFFVSISGVSAHGADITEDTMVIANESNGVIAKYFVDDLGVNVSVYKFTSSGDVEHQLEHALSNPNKRILAISYQDVVNDYLLKHEDLKNRILVSSDDNESLKRGLQDLTNINTGSTNNDDFITPLVVGLIIGFLIGIVSGVFIIKKKNN